MRREVHVAEMRKIAVRLQRVARTGGLRSRRSWRFVENLQSCPEAARMQPETSSWNERTAQPAGG